MLNVITVLRSGGDYTRDYAVNLRRNVAQHLETEHRFLCLTDQVRETEYDEDTGIQWEPLRHDWPGWWSKVEVFRPDLERYGRLLFLDLSCIPIGDLSDIAGYDGSACVTSDFYHGGPSQSVLSFAPGTMRKVWDLFTSDPAKWMAEGDKMVAPDFGDQILFNRVFGPDGLDRWQTLLPNQVVSFKVHCREGIPAGARLVKFHGRPRIHECEEPWVTAAWRVGMGLASYVSHCNTPMQTVMDQVRHNSENQDVPWLTRPDRPEPHVCIVGGGPSLAQAIPALKLRRRRGHPIWATNGTHDYLIEHGVVPDRHFVMDARPHNLRFLAHPHPDVTYMLASRVDPALFEAVRGHTVVLWHGYDEGIVEYLGERFPDRPWCAFTGGGTVGMRLLEMAHVLGHRHVHLYGFDSCYQEGRNHAYSQPENDGERVVHVFANDRAFHAAPWMVRQAEDFQVQYRKLAVKGFRVTVHGPGLLAYIARHMDLSPPEFPKFPHHKVRQRLEGAA